MSNGWNYLQNKKSVIVECLKIRHDTVPAHCDVEIIDGFFLHLMKDIPQTFGKLAKSILQKLTSTPAPEMNLTFDQYLQPSIKDYDSRQEATKKPIRLSAYQDPIKRYQLESSQQQIQRSFGSIFIVLLG